MAKRVSLAQLVAIIEDAPKRIQQAAIRGARSAAYRLEGMVVESIAATEPYPPEDTGELKRSIHTTKIPDGAIVTADAPHAPFMEFGTRPHFPPIQPLADWAYRKGLADSEDEAQAVAFSICRKIAARGIEPRHFMARAVQELERQGIVKEEIVAEMKRAGWEG